MYKGRHPSFTCAGHAMLVLITHILQPYNIVQTFFKFSIKYTTSCQMTSQRQYQFLYWWKTSTLRYWTVGIWCSGKAPYCK